MLTKSEAAKAASFLLVRENIRFHIPLFRCLLGLFHLMNGDDDASPFQFFQGVRQSIEKEKVQLSISVHPITSP